MNHQLAAAARCVWVTTRIARTTADPRIKLDALATLACVARVSPHPRLRRTAVGALDSIAGRVWAEALLADATDNEFPGDAA